MRSFLRGLAAVQLFAVGAVAVTSVASVVGAVNGIVTAFESAVLFVVFLTLSSVGGVLWCLASAPAVGREQPPYERRPMRFWLRVLAQIELGAGLIVVVATAGYASYHFWIHPFSRGRPLEALGLLYVTLGLMGMGGVLWCAVRVAYPDHPTEKN